MHEHFEQMLTEKLSQYRVLRLLSQSHTADVFLGEHLYLKTLVALKIIRQPLSLAECQVFEERIQQIARLDHPHIVRLLEYALLENRPCLVTDYAPHGTLRTYHAQGSQLLLTGVVHYVTQIAPALQYIHERELVHGDLKPENVLLDAQNELLLHDFGFTPNAQPQQAIGTIFYMAPEQFNGHTSTASDQYALAIMIWEWLAGLCPFRGTYAEVAAQHFQAAPHSLRPYRPDIPAELDAVLAIALQKAPERRFLTIQAFLRAFQQACFPHTLSLQKSSLPSTNTSVAQQAGGMPSRTQVAPSLEPVSSLPSVQPEVVHHIKRRTVLSSIAGGTVALIGGGSLFWWLRQQAQNNSQIQATPTPLVPGTLLYIYKGHTTPVADLVWSPTGSHIASMDQDTTHIWPANGIGKRIQIAQAGENTLNDVPRWSPDGKLLIASSLPVDGISPFVTIWDASTGQIFKQIRIPQANELHFAGWSSNSHRFRLLTIGTNQTSFSRQEWEVSSGTMTQTNSLPELPSTNLFFTSKNNVLLSPDGKYIVEESNIVENDGTFTASIVDIMTGATNATFSVPAHVNDQDACWSLNGERIGIFSMYFYIFDAKTGKSLSTSVEKDIFYPGVADLSPDGKYGSFTNDRIVYICDAATGKTLLSYHGHTTAVGSLAWSPDSTHVASAPWQGQKTDTSVNVWQAIG